MADYVSRLPVYLLLDTSGSMSGYPIHAVSQGVKALVSDLKDDPRTREVVCLSVITFNSTAKQVSPLTELMLFQEPELVAGGATALGRALEVLMDCIENEVRPSTPDQKGDRTPKVFILTDGDPTDDVTVFRHAVANLPESLKKNINVFAIGPNVSPGHLEEITPCVIYNMAEFFAWSCNLPLDEVQTPGGDVALVFSWLSRHIKRLSDRIDAKPIDAKSIDAVQLPPPRDFVIEP